MKRLAELSRDLNKIDSCGSRGSLPSERLLWALLPQSFYTVRSGAAADGAPNFNLLSLSFAGVSIDGPVWDAPVF